MWKRKVFKILISIILLICIVDILFVFNLIYGNPISAFKARKEIKKYVTANYPQLESEVSKAKYNYKVTSYVAEVKSNNEETPKFSVHYKDGRYYDENVTRVANAQQKFLGEYSDVSKSLIKDKLGYENDSVVSITEFDNALPLDYEIYINLNSIENSTESISKFLIDAHKVLVDNGYIFKKYHLDVKHIATANNITPKDIESGQLGILLEKGKDNKSEAGIHTYIKDEKK